MWSPSTHGTVTGWGLTQVQRCDDVGICYSDPRSNSDTLVKLDDVQLMSREKCDNIYHDTLQQYSIKKGSMCGLSRTGDSCRGDSGSGLIHHNRDRKQYELVGVVSYGPGCNSSFNGVKLPGVYADVRSASVLDWVKWNISRGQFCDAPHPPSLTPGTGSWGQWSSFTQCRGFGRLGKRRRERQCTDPSGKGCGRLFEVQERPCLL